MAELRPSKKKQLVIASGIGSTHSVALDSTILQGGVSGLDFLKPPARPRPRGEIKPDVTVKNVLFATIQYISASLTWLLLQIFTDFKIEGQHNLSDVTRPFIAVANHESHLDPQLTGVALLSQPSLFPLRFMAKDQLFKIPGLNLIMWALGAFRAHKKEGIGKSLLTPIRILERGGGVIMFPEGHIIPERPHLGEGRRGAAILALTTRATLVPMSLHTPAHFTFIDFLFKRKQVVILIGEPFRLNHLDYPDFSDDNMYKATRVIMKNIFELYFRHKY